MTDIKSEKRTLSDSDPEPESDTMFISATEFCNADNRSDWEALEALIDRGHDAPRVNRYERNSLFLNFDPLVSLRQSLINPNRNISNSLREAEAAEECSPESYTTARDFSGFSFNNRMVSVPVSPNMTMSGPVSPITTLLVPVSPYTVLSVPVSPNTMLSVPVSPNTMLSVPVPPNTMLSAPLVPIKMKSEPLSPMTTLPVPVSSITTVSASAPVSPIKILSASVPVSPKEEVVEEKHEADVVMTLEKTFQIAQNKVPDKEQTKLSELEMESKLMDLARQKENLEIDLTETLLNIKLAQYQYKSYVKELDEMESTFAKALLLYEGGKKLQQNFEQNQILLSQREVYLNKALALREDKLNYIQQSIYTVMEGCRNDQKERLAEVENENMKLKAKVRMAEMEANNLESQIGQSVIESEKLRTLCDELIKR